MPKEYIVTRSTRKRTDELGGLTEAVRVGWDSYDSVQIATVLMAPCDGGPDGAASPYDQGAMCDLTNPKSLTRIHECTSVGSHHVD